jgi:hypothetical protein
MKIFLLLLLSLIVVQPVKWIDDIDKVVEHIDLNAKLVKSKTVSDSTSEVTYKESKINKAKKSIFQGVSKTKNIYTFNFKYYQLNNKIIFRSTDSFDRYFSKGSHQSLPYANIKEVKKYYKSESVGIQYSRRIDVYVNQNIDSLKMELKKLDFVATDLTIEDYKKDVSALKRLRKGF